MKKGRLVSSPCMHQLFANVFCLPDLQIPIKLRTLRQEKKHLYPSQRGLEDVRKVGDLASARSAFTAVQRSLKRAF